jgi:hypothetical protein
MATPSMLNRFRQLLQSHKAFAVSIDEAIKTRSARLHELVDKIEQHATHKNSARKFSDVHEYLFISARVYKMCTRSEDDRLRIRAATTSMLDSIPWTRLNDDQCATALWALATVGAGPVSLVKLQLMNREFLSNKSFSNVVWSLARFAEAGDSSLVDNANSLLSKMNTQTAESLSNDELVSILRALATIHSQ